MGRMSLRSNALIPELAVQSLGESLAFYRDLLGFAVAYARPEEGFAFLQLGDAQLMLDQIGLDNLAPVLDLVILTAVASCLNSKPSEVPQLAQKGRRAIAELSYQSGSPCQ